MFHQPEIVNSPNPNQQKENALSDLTIIHHLEYLSMLNCCKVNEEDGIENVDKGKGNTEVTNYSIIFPLLPL